MEFTADRMAHGYTNLTVAGGGTVTKTYVGPQVADRLGREAAVLRAIGPVVPVPSVLSAGADSVTLRRMSGTHGQDALRPDTAARVLGACGRMLARIHAVPTGVLPFGAARAGTVLVHGDYGPNNVLLSPDLREVTAVLDWEWCRLGSPVEDLAWCEWVVRMHHADCVDALPHLFHAYGMMPPWERRRGAMLNRIREVREWCAAAAAQGDTAAADSVDEWRRREAVTSGWRD